MGKRSTNGPEAAPLSAKSHARTGTLGRSRRSHFQRWPHGRRKTRSQRASSYALYAHFRWTAGGRLRSGHRRSARQKHCRTQSPRPRRNFPGGLHRWRIFRGNNEVGELLGAEPCRIGSRERDSQVRIARLESAATVPDASAIEPQRLAAAMGWTEDQFRLLFQPLAREGKEAVWSMGDDAPPAFLSFVKRPLWDYCKQRFAQVTNPPIDPLREVHVMSLDVYLDPNIVAGSPVLDAGHLAALQSRLVAPLQRIDFTFEAAGGTDAARAALQRVREEISAAVTDNSNRSGELRAVIVLSDRAASEQRAALPAMLAVSAAWKEMVRAGAHDVPVIVESGQVIETHHIALLIAVGASAVFPYLAMELSENL